MSVELTPQAALTGVAEYPINRDHWHGWGWRDNRHPDLHIGPLPKRKQLALYTEVVDGDNVAHIRILAYFRWPRDAYAAMAAIDALTGHRP